MSWGLVIVTAICFGLGFGLSWIRARRRVHARIRQALEVEIKNRMQAELLKRIERGDCLDLSSSAPQPHPSSESDSPRGGF